MIRWYLVPVCIPVLVVLAGCARPDHQALPPVDTVQALEWMADDTFISRIDVPGARMLSTADPSGGNTDWYTAPANPDSEWKTIADLEGPGLLTRVWMTGADSQQRIRLFLDDAEEPVLEGLTPSFFGKTAPFLAPLAHMENICFLSQLPVPYAKRLRLEVSQTRPDQRFYYQVNYVPLPAGTEVLTARMTDPVWRTALEERVLPSWRNPTAPSLDTPTAGCQRYRHPIDLQPGEARELPLPEGPGVVRLLGFRPDSAHLVDYEQRRNLLRGVMVECLWDDAEGASIRVPLGDLTGNPRKVTRVITRYFGATDDLLFNRFPMPFNRKATIRLIHTGDLPVSLEAVVDLESTTADALPGSYLHACWKFTAGHSPATHHQVLRVREAKGGYVGCIMALENSDNGWWMLEGDETIRVDEEHLPSWRGTGLEDYFNGGFYFQHPVAHPFHGLLTRVPFRALVYRIHQLDRVTFEESVDIRFERHIDRPVQSTIASTAFYYLDRPQEAASSRPDFSLLQSARPEMEQATMMGELRDLERLGDLRGAWEHAAAMLPQQPEAYRLPLALRRWRYAQSWQTPEEAEAALAMLRETYASDPRLPGYLEALQAGDQGDGDGLAVVYASPDATVYLDGRPLGTTPGATRVGVFTPDLPPGRHVLTVEQSLNSQRNWLQVLVRQGAFDLRSQTGWDRIFDPLPAWRTGTGGEEGTHPAPFHNDPWPPRLPHLVLEPHPFVGFDVTAFPFLSLSSEGAKTVGHRIWFEVPDPTP